MSKICSVFLAGIVLSVISFVSHGQSISLKFITLEVAPWAYTEKDNPEYIGMFPDIVKELEQRTGFSIEIRLTPYARINRELETARQDCTVLISEEERSQVVVRGELVFNHPMGVVARKDIPLKQYDDLYNLKISLLRGSTISEKFNGDEELHKSYDTDYQISLRKVMHKRLDAIAGAIPTIQYLAKTHGMEDVFGEPLELSSEPIYLQCSKTSKNLHHLETLNEAIRAIKADGTLNNILNQY